MISLKTILVATDFSEPSEVAVRYGRALAEAFPRVAPHPPRRARFARPAMGHDGRWSCHGRHATPMGARRARAAGAAAARERARGGARGAGHAHGRPGATRNGL